MKYAWTLLLMVAAALAGLYLGWVSGNNAASGGYGEDQRGPMTLGGGKLDEVLELVENFYVDPIDMDSLQELAIPQVMKQLDPHSVYIPRSDVERVNGELKSDFGGIGVTFSIREDTVRVMSVVAGGPSSALGVLPGDKIIKVNGKDFAGKAAGLTNQKVLDNLRGEIGTKVSISILRHPSTTLDFDIVRGEIPLISVVSTYEIAPGVGYMRIDRFAEKTYEEMIAGIGKLKAEGCDKLIVDLRSNAGGFLNVVQAMCNEFLGRGEMIVYTEGGHQRRQESRADGTGTCRDMGLTVLIDEFSASASEIFAGAMQDNDRGTIIGRRSFGKGLVQTELTLADQSHLRLTVSRYHTPSGRCIQRPYDHGDEEYYQDINERYKGGELFSADSIKADTAQVFHTRKGRVVYGGGGIVPDIFVPFDTASASRYLYTLRSKRLIYDYAMTYVDGHRDQLKRLTAPDLIHLLQKTPFIDGITAYAAKYGVARPARLEEKESLIIANEVRAYVGQAIKDNDGFYPILNTMDPVIDKALETLNAKSLY